MDAREYVALADWRRRIAALYAAVRSERDAGAAWQMWRAERDRLFREHPQSPLAAGERVSFEALPYFDYEPAARITATLSDAPQERHELPTSTGEPMVLDRFASAGFRLFGRSLSLDVYWVAGYGGGIFLPFRDSTSGASTYGAGRYLLDTVKGADLGMSGELLVLDFNFAYNPSCSYDPRWACPLAPPANTLPLGVRAGERT